MKKWGRIGLNAGTSQHNELNIVQSWFSALSLQYREVIVYSGIVSCFVIKMRAFISSHSSSNICCRTKSRVRGHLRLYLGYFTSTEGESPSADSPTPPSLEVLTCMLAFW